MGYIKQGNYMLMCGRVTREAKIRQTKKGKSVSSFAMQYDFHHNEDGAVVNDYIDVSVWGENAKYVGAEDVGIARNDIVLVFGYLMQDNYHTKETGEPTYKVYADVVLDMTSIFQVAKMVVGSGLSDEPAEKQPPLSAQASVFTEMEDDADPFMTPETESDYDLPY